MLLPIIWGVALMGFVAVVVGGMRISNPAACAEAIAKKEQRKKASDLDLKKAKSSGLALVVMGPLLIGLWIYVQFVMR